MAKMFLLVWALLLLAASASASSWRNDYAVDWLLRRVGVETIRLEDFSFDVDYATGIFSGFVEFHLENGTVSNLRRRVPTRQIFGGLYFPYLSHHVMQVRRIGSCDFIDEGHQHAPHFRVCCSLSMRGLIAKYDVEVIIDGKSKTVPAEVLVDKGSTHSCIDRFLGNCTKCTKYGYRTLNLTTKLIALKVSLGVHNLVLTEFQKEILSQVEKEITVAIETTYLPALEKKMAALKITDFNGQPRL